MAQPPLSDIQAMLGARVLKLREARGLSQLDLGLDLGIGERRVRLIERGRANLTLSSLVVLASYFDVPVYVLLKPAKLTERKPGRPPRKKTSRAKS